MSKPYTNRNTLKLYWNQIRKFKPSFLTMLIMIPSAAVFFDTGVPYFLSQAIGNLPDQDFTQILVFLAAAGISAICGYLLNLIGFQVGIKHEANVRKALVLDTMNRLIMKDRDFFSNQKIGALTGKFIDFVNAHIGIQDLFIIRTLTFVLSITSGMVIIYLNSWFVGTIVLGLLVWLIIQIKITIKIRTPYRHARKEQIAEVNGVAADIISNNLTVKTFAHEKREIANLESFTEKLRRVWNKDLRILSFEGSMRLLLVSIVQIIAIAALAYLLTNNQIQLGIAIFVIAYLQRIASQLFLLGELINGYDRLFLQAAPMTEILFSDHLIKDKPGAKALIVNKGELNFKNVTFTYDDNNDSKVLDNFNLKVDAGEKIGLIGRSGAGKTTITSLLLRFSDIDDGEILIDGQNISTITQESLRQNIAFVPQEPMLFHRTLRENILYGKPDATDQELLEATQHAHALEFIQQLPNGFDTVVGERGVKLSGGQRQRIAIARALLKDAPILILDEATSALDSESEELIQDALSKLMKNKTSIVIAHRLSTIAKMDRIVVMGNGKIIEQGTHKGLLTHEGTYAKLWKHQSGGFIDE